MDSQIVNYKGRQYQEINFPHNPANAWVHKLRAIAHEAPDQLLANPFNARRHSEFQRKAIVGSLDKIGWVDELKVNLTTQHMFNGHARLEESMKKGEATVPVSYYELTLEEEAAALAFYDRITQLAYYDPETLDELFRKFDTTDEALTKMLADMADQHNIYFENANVNTDEIDLSAFTTPENTNLKYRVVIDELTKDEADELAASTGGKVEQYRAK